jgi:hypothetical protein
MMNVKRVIVAIVVAYVVLMLTNWLVHDVWLMAAYRAIPDSWRPIADMNHKLWILAIGQFFFAAMFAYIYARGAEKKPWLGQGIRYGIVMTLMTVVPYSLTEFVTYRVPHMLAVKWMIGGTIQLIILGLIVAGIYKPSE